MHLLLHQRGCSSLRRGAVKVSSSFLPFVSSFSSRFTAGCLFVCRHHSVAAVVVGGGPAGIAAVGHLLEQFEQNGNQKKVAWVDPDFRGGRINRKYREVPSNTTAGLFTAYAQAVKPFREICEAAPPEKDGVAKLQQLPQDKTCSLYYAGDMLQVLTDGLLTHNRVEAYRGRVTDATWDTEASKWTVTIKNSGAKQLTSPLVVLCTGSSPTTVSLPTSTSSQPRLLDLDVALKPSELAQVLQPSQDPSKPLTIGVVGASHSAILVLMNLFRLSQTPTHRNLSVKWFARSPNLKYAVPQQNEDGSTWILYDNTGLKGQAAEFARAQLDGEALDSSEAGKVITRVDCSGGQEAERKAFETHLPDCDYVVQAIGFTRDALPTIKFNKHTENELRFDHESGAFRTDDKTEIPGLYGAGIAFPERVVDPHGNVEYAVGFWKFVRFLKRVVPEWVSKTHN
ncbi:pyridine nucleotide-disulfide oxidoreductase-domain-containing protein [Diplogelasinospora grovesii]|uniref:Pyridine nucleotide-disulfide oxidoreductase-domain-containing protein n=1 Tax=Diplogelasinospora grovesii TaxID=303347 RepID=A0AAN6S1G3_9PEZI|nr:pyridine nucleotide-disulfide oxidoreductase-domain-containing protein [Diplogelasinospora grovesii]